MPPCQKDTAYQIEKLFYGLVSISIIFIVFAVVGILFMLENKEALVIYSLILAINLIVASLGFLFIRCFNKFITKMEEDDEKRNGEC